MGGRLCSCRGYIFWLGVSFSLSPSLFPSHSCPPSILSPSFPYLSIRPPPTLPQAPTASELASFPASQMLTYMQCLCVSCDLPRPQGSAGLWWPKWLLLTPPSPHTHSSSPYRPWLLAAPTPDEAYFYHRWLEISHFI